MVKGLSVVLFCLFVTMIGFQNCSNSNMKFAANPGSGEYASSGELVVKDMIVHVGLNTQKTIAAKEFQTSFVDVNDEIVDIALVEGGNGQMTSQVASWGSLKISDDKKSIQYQTKSLGNRKFQFVAFSKKGRTSQFSITFLTDNPLQYLKPALVVGNATCITCHGSIVGNLLSDGNGAVNLESLDSIRPLGDYYNGKMISTYATSFIKGQIIVPKITIWNGENKRTLSSTEQYQEPGTNLTAIWGVLPRIKNTFLDLSNTDPTHSQAPIALSSMPDSVQTFAEYLNAVINFRTKEYIDYLAKGGPFPIYAKKRGLQPDTSIRQVNKLKINAPSEAEILKSINTDDLALGFTYYKQGDDAFELKGFEKHGSYFRNIENQELECDGDLFVNGVVVLKNLKLRSNYGCRIYATKTVFLNAPDGKDQRNGIQYLGGAQANLQILSARDISLGLGSCTSVPSGQENYYKTKEDGSFGRRAYDGSRNYSATPYSRTSTWAQIINDFHQVQQQGADLKDAGDCQGSTDLRRKVSFEKLLLVAPRINSRYTGDFKGIMIGQVVIGALGQFSYIYDPVFESVPILPMISSDSYLTIQDCIKDGVDMAKKMDKLFVCQ